jgi:SulP family sulfate permease
VILKTYKKAYLKSNITAALTVAIITILQSMACAIIAGLDPVYDLYTAIVSMKEICELQK